MAGKEIDTSFVIQIPAQSATPAPPVGSTMGQKGVNIKKFCDEFNAQSAKIERGTLVGCKVVVYKDKSFKIYVSQPLTSVLLKKFAKLKKGSSAPGRESAGKIKHSDVEEIAKIKMVDMGVAFDSAVKTVIGTARSMGLEVTQ